MPKNRKARKSPAPRPSLLPTVAILLAATLAAVAGRSAFRAQLTGEEIPPFADALPVCRAGAYGDLFAADISDPKGEKWDKKVTETLGKIFEDMGKGSDEKISCTDDVKSEAPASVQALAKKLPQWKRKEKIFTADIPAVLLDYLEAYGCALREKGLSLPLDLQNASSANTFTAATQTFDWFSAADRRLTQLRETLRRSLLVTMGREKFAPLEHAFTCLNRTSKDLRNLFGLLGEAGACLPIRTWDTRDTLRDLSSSEGTPASP